MKQLHLSAGLATVCVLSAMTTAATAAEVSSPVCREDFMALEQLAQDSREVMFQPFEEPPLLSVMILHRSGDRGPMAEIRDALIIVERIGEDWSARMRRAKDRGIWLQVMLFRDSQRQAGIDDAAPVECPKLTRETMSAALQFEDFETTSKACPALLLRLEALQSLPFIKSEEQTLLGPLPGPIITEGHGYGLRISTPGIDLKLMDSSFSSEAYEWMEQTEEALEQCWRPTGSGPALPPQAPGRLIPLD